MLRCGKYLANETQVTLTGDTRTLSVTLTLGPVREYRVSSRRPPAEHRHADCPRTDRTDLVRQVISGREVTQIEETRRLTLLLWSRLEGLVALRTTPVRDHGLGVSDPTPRLVGNRWSTPGISLSLSGLAPSHPPSCPSPSQTYFSAVLVSRFPDSSFPRETCLSSLSVASPPLSHTSRSFFSFRSYRPSLTSSSPRHPVPATSRGIRNPGCGRRQTHGQPRETETGNNLRDFRGPPVPGQSGRPERCRARPRRESLPHRSRLLIGSLGRNGVGVH